MNKKITAIILVCSFLTMIYAQKITIKIASIAPSRSPWDIDQRSLAQEWSKITNGQVTLSFYDTTALGGEHAVIQKMRSVRPGQKSPLDGAIFTNIGVYELAPKTEIYTMSLPFLFRNQEELDIALTEYGPGMKNAIEEEGYVLLGWFNVGWVTFFTKDEVKTLADFKKIKISAAGLDSAAIDNVFKSAGYNTEAMPSDKILQSLKSNSGLRGFYSIPMFAYATQYSKEVNYALDTSICPVMAALVVTKQVWDTVPAQYKPALLEAVRKTGDQFVITQKETDRKYLDIIANEGVTLVKFDEATRVKWETDFFADVPAMIKDPKSAINGDFLKRIQKTLTGHRGK